MSVLPLNIQQAELLQLPEVLFGLTFTINVGIVQLACISNPYGVYGVQQQMDGVCVCVCVCAHVTMSVQFTQLNYLP